MRDTEWTDAQIRAGGILTIEITSWLGENLLGVIPVVAGSWKVTDTYGVTVPGTVEFSVPALDQWRPVAPDHPLAAVGQRFRVRVGYGDQLVTWGWYRAARPVREGAVIRCTGIGLLRDVERARFTRPLQSKTGQTWRAVLADLLRGILPVDFDAAPADAVQPVTTWEEDRLAAVWEIIESRPARLVIDDSATAVVLPPWNDTAPGPAVAQLVDGAGGTLVELDPDGDTDEDPPNGYVVSTVPDGDVEPITEVWTMPDGPMKWGGPYGYNPAFFASPLNPSDRVKLRAIAERMTRRAVQQTLRFGVVSLPDPRLEVGDVVHVRSARYGVDGLARITNLALTRTATTTNVALL
ncbi:MAG: hypothetical protein QM582_09565 [Micropruina sp.]|uniref:hypothetical protein n=1 Tax=Micropruina sp. TaxID=2737536 RepID=UPI0039E5EAB4